MVATDQMISSSLSDVGRTRKENQDACGEFASAAGERLLVVADGMGGHAGGVTASRLCIETVARIFETAEGTPAERLRYGFEESNRAVWGAAQADESLRGMGTTGVALLFDQNDTVWLGWVGDSRAYRYRNGQLEQLSDDHSVVMDWVRSGTISAEEAETHPRRNELNRAIGPDSRVEVDVRSFPIEPGDIYMLCSDGLCGYMRDPDIAAIMGFESPENAVRQLVDKVNVEQNSPDNVTVQIMAVPAAAGALVAPGGPAMDYEDEEFEDMSMGDGDFDNSGYPRTKKMFLIGIAVLIVAALLAGAAWYGMNAKGTDRAAATQVDPQADAMAAAAAAEEARLAAEQVEAAAQRQAALAAALDAKAKADEEARLESARLAEVARAATAAREAALAKEIADAKAALAQEQATARAAAAKFAAEQAAARERILAEQEARRQAAIAAEEARSVEIAFNMAVEVDTFVSDWRGALERGDYPLYKELGFRESEEEFLSLYGDGDAEFEIAVVEKKQWVGGFVALRVTETYEPGGGEAVAQRTQRRLVLRPTNAGLRFAGDRN